MLILLLIPIENSFSQLDSVSLEKCVVGDYRRTTEFGSWSINVEKEKDGLCYFNYNNEMEGGYSDKKCVVPTNEIKVTDWSGGQLHYSPIEHSLVEQYCSVVNQGNFFENMLILVILMTLGGTVVLSLIIHFVTWAIVKKIFHKKYPKMIGGVAVILFLLIGSLWYVYSFGLVR